MGAISHGSFILVYQLSFMIFLHFCAFYIPEFINLYLKYYSVTAAYHFFKHLAVSAHFEKVTHADKKKHLKFLNVNFIVIIST